MYIFNLVTYNNPTIIDDNKENTDFGYINASVVDGGPLEKDKGLFIAAQGPMKNTVTKFWKLVLQKGVSTIIMLCNEVEDLRVSL